MKLEKSFCSVVLIILIITALTTVLALLCSAVVSEASDFAGKLIENIDEANSPLQKMFEYASSLREKIPFLKENKGAASDAIYDGAVSFVKNALGKVVSLAANAASSLFGKLPRAVFGFVTALISLFYITTGKDTVLTSAEPYIGSNAVIRIRKIKKRTIRALSKYVRNYLFILVITFAELFLGLVLLRVDYALLLALVIALVDFLPVVGTGIIMLPWSALSFLGGSARRGTGILVLWLVMYLVRQFIEPKLVGDAIGVHPLVSLFSIYLGFISCGVAGMILFPIALYVVKASLPIPEK